MELFKSLTMLVTLPVLNTLFQAYVSSLFTTYQCHLVTLTSKSDGILIFCSSEMKKIKAVHGTDLQKDWIAVNLFMGHHHLPS
jgi:hypothetical protein